MPAMSQYGCFVCGNTVIGLKAQDLYLDTVLLDDHPDAEVLVNAQAFGPCHALCLTNSTYGGKWFRFLSRRLTRNSSIVFEDDAYLCVNDWSGTAVLRRDGWYVEVNGRPIAVSESGYLFQVEENLYIDFSSNRRLGETVRKSVMGRRQVSLIEILSGLGIAPFLLYPEAVSDGVVFLSKEYRDERGRPCCDVPNQEDVLYIAARYKCLIPNTLPHSVFGSYKRTTP